MSKKFVGRVALILAILGLFWLAFEQPDVKALDASNALPGGMMHPGRQYVGGWYVESYYMDLDSCWGDSLASMVDTQYTNWLHVGSDWEAFWVQFDWVYADTQAQLDSLDTLESVVIQGCLDPVNYPTVYTYCTMLSDKADTGTWQWYQPIDSLTYNPPLPYLRAQIIFEVTVYWNDWCTNDTLEGACASPWCNEQFELRWKPLDVY